jgi:hypothetical protein
MVELKQTNRQPAFTKDSIGRNVTMQLKAGQTLMEVRPYWVSEKIYDYQQKKHIDFDMLQDSLDSIFGIKMLYKLNSYLIMETEDLLHFYCLKSVADCRRLIDAIISYRINDGKTDCMYARDVNTLHRKYLYEHLAECGLTRQKLYRHGTR